MEEVAMAILPIVAFFLIFNFVSLRLDKKTLIKIFVGLIFTYIGLVLFLTGANIGFMPIGQYIGESLAGSGFSWILIPIGMIIGYFIVSAEPAVHVLKQHSLFCRRNKECSSFCLLFHLCQQKQKASFLREQYRSDLRREVICRAF